MCSNAIADCERIVLSSGISNKEVGSKDFNDLNDLNCLNALNSFLS